MFEHLIPKITPKKSFPDNFSITTPTSPLNRRSDSKTVIPSVAAHLSPKIGAAENKKRQKDELESAVDQRDKKVQ